MDRAGRIIELVDNFLNERAVMSMKDWDNILLEIIEENEQQ